MQGATDLQLRKAQVAAAGPSLGPFGSSLLPSELKSGQIESSQLKRGLDGVAAASQLKAGSEASKPGPVAFWPAVDLRPTYTQDLRNTGSCNAEVSRMEWHDKRNVLEPEHFRVHG